MKIKSARYIKSITGTDSLLYDGKFQIAFMGRSNVGKSTLINSFMLHNLARFSSNPGKTDSMDFFLINDRFYLVDFPGYGYARVPQKKLEKLRKMILWYLMFSEVKDRCVIVIVDINIGLTDFDRQIIQIIEENNINHLIVANKTDKLKQGELDRKLKEITKEYPHTQIIPYSAKYGKGREVLSAKLQSYF